MSERDLNRAVALRTGESVESIQRLGFQVLGDEHVDEDLGPLVFDWERRQAAYLRQLLSDDDWPGKTWPLPSHDEDFDDELDQEYAVAAA
ncbi:hypothetical protein Pan44_39200 [Caulifigura coniformis]|uniref:Uncharacterized protein n=1 Tax=Caulifigura coniformis TaxID=2527983 RepID=A0A517SID3_9PLAN|nr:hypothetical protein [Caulifigura coniformis]QDT55872.1 hypothetical protein Pan44_39200 [Caulifigura coniformis]